MRDQLFSMLKKVFLLLLLVIPTSILAQDDSEPEKSTPTYGKTIMRRVSKLNVEGIRYEDVEVVLVSNEPSAYIGPNVRILVKRNGEKIYKKRFNNAYLYIFSSGEIHVGTPKFPQLLISPPDYDGGCWGEIREYEGVF